MMRNSKRIKLVVFLALVSFFFAGCNRTEVRFFENELESGELRIIKWERKNNIVTIDFMIDTGDCYEVYERTILKKFNKAVALRQNGFWVPYFYLDESKAAIFGSGYTNYTCFVKNELVSRSSDDYLLVQERENLDGSTEFFNLKYSSELIPISMISFDGLVVYQKGIEISDISNLRDLCQ